MAEYHRWYRTGTASVANGSTAVTGALTAWQPNARAGDSITFDGGAKWYEVASVEDNTHLTLGSAFGETTVAGGNYAIGRSGPAWSQVADVAKQFTELIDSQTDIFSGDGAPSDELGADGSAYFQGTPPKFYLKAAGTWGTGTSIVGPQGPAGPSFAGSSSSSVAIGVGSKALVAGTGLAYSAGMRVRATATSDPTKWMEGVVTAYTGGTLTFTSDLTSGSGTINSWSINTAGERGAIGLTGPSYIAASTTSLSIATGAKALTIAAGLAYSVGSRVRAASAADPTNFMEGPCTAYTGTTLTIGVDLIGGTGTFADWNLSIAGQRGATGASYAATSTTSRNLGTGSMSFATQANLAVVVGTRLRFASVASPTTKWMEGVASAYSGTSLTADFDLYVGSGAVNDWTISLAGERGQQGIQGIQGTQGIQGVTGPNSGLDYSWDVAFDDSDPGNGDVKVDAASWASATKVFVSKTGRNAEALETVIENLFATANAHRGHLRIFPTANRAIYFEADVVDSIVDGTTYWKIPVTNVVASLSQPAAAAAMSVVIDRSGEGAVQSALALVHALGGGL